MAGRPRTRARREAEAAGDVPEAPASGEPPIPPSTPNTEPAPYRRQRPSAGKPSGWDLGAGPESRKALDSERAATIHGLASALRPGVSVRIWRLRPTWCAGWIEDATIEQASVGEILDYLRSEHGGTAYKLQAVTPRGDVMYEALVPVAGPPRDAGRLLLRDEYERAVRGERSSSRSTPHNPAAPSVDLVGLLTLVLSESRESRAATLASVEKMTEATRKQTEHLLGHVMRPPQGSIAEQLRGVGEATMELRKVGRAIGSLTGGDAPASSSPSDARSSAIQNLMLQALMGNRGGGEQQRYPRRQRVVVVQPPPGAPPATSSPANGAGAIPEAQPSSRTRARPS